MGVPTSKHIERRAQRRERLFLMPLLNTEKTKGAATYKVATPERFGYNALDGYAVILESPEVDAFVSRAGTTAEAIGTLVNKKLSISNASMPEHA